MLTYIAGGLLGLLSGAVAVFFAFGGILERRLFLRLWKGRGGWRRTWCVMLVLAAAMGVYGIWLFGGVTREYGRFLLLGSYLLSVSVTDLRRRYLPDDAALFWGLALMVMHLSYLSLPAMFSALLGGVLGAVLLGVPHLLKRDAIGAGDIKLLAVCGLATGFPGVVYFLVRGLLFMALYSAVQLMRKKVNLGSQLPVAPFLFLSALL